MASGNRIIERLPSLYRPEPGYDDDDLLLQLSMSIGSLLDRLGQEGAEVMQAHWFDYADSAIYSTWLGRRRTLNREGPLKLSDPLIDQFPYLFALPRIAALVDLSPWQEPLRDRERVEVFRERVRRIIRLHRNGLGTVRALRTMTLAALPQIDPDAPAGLRERSFTVEEFSGIQQLAQAISQVGLPPDRVGPLMRWSIDSDSISDLAPMVVITGLTPEPGKIDATSEPIIERFEPATGTGVGIHYQGDLAPGQALALVPGYQSWLGGDGGIDRADATPVGIEPVNPTAPGPWVAESTPPPGRVVDLQHTEDRYLWAAVNSGGAGSLWRSSGGGWSEELGGGLPEVRCLLPLGNEMWVGFTTGLSRLEIQPGGAFALDPDPSTLTDPAVNALAVDRAGNVWAATDQGLARLESGALTYTLLGNRSETETPLRALWIDASGDVYAGGELGLFLHRTAHDRFYILLDEKVDEAEDDWLALDLAGGALPDPTTIFVPPVHAVMHGPDTHIWLGTAQGIARYRAREQRRTYSTLLEAMPQLTETPVTQIRSDARGRLWFATGEGLFVFDQLDWFQRQGDAAGAAAAAGRGSAAAGALALRARQLGLAARRPTESRRLPEPRAGAARKQRAGGSLDGLDRDCAGAPGQLRWRNLHHRWIRYSSRTGNALQTGADAHCRRRFPGGAAAAERPLELALLAARRAFAADTGCDPGLDARRAVDATPCRTRGSVRGPLSG